MKIMNKIIALVAACATVVACAVTASANFDAVTLTPSATTVKAGDTITVDTTWNSLVGAKGLQIKITYDTDAFSVDTSNNTSYNFGTALKKSYLQKFIANDFVASRYDYMKNENVDANFNITTMFPSLTAAANGDAVTYVFADTSGSTVIDADLESFAANSTLGTIFTVKDGVADGEYTFNVEMISSDKDAGDIKRTATATVKVGEDKPEEPQITINNKYVFNFTADAGQEVMVKLTRTNGIESDLTYSLPELVKGEASIFGLLKVTDNTVVSGDKFDISVVDADRNPVKAITTITVD